MKGYYGSWEEERTHEDDEEDSGCYDRAALYLARTLAANAGMQWDRLASYPGFHRNRFYDQARRMLETLDGRRGELPTAA